jgi:hypothetical protein
MLKIKAGQVWIDDCGSLKINSVNAETCNVDEVFMGRSFDGISLYTNVLIRIIENTPYKLVIDANEIWKELCLK